MSEDGSEEIPPDPFRPPALSLIVMSREPAVNR